MVATSALLLAGCLVAAVARQEGLMSVRPEQFHLDVRRNKVVLKELAALVTEEIVRRSSTTGGWDFRFMLIVGQWLIEQGRYTMRPEGNNPGNVMGKGDAGFFQRSYNTEFIDGKRVAVPEAKFAAYSSMQVATAVKFDKLRDRWPAAYTAVLAGASPEAYVKGLYPGPPRNYATAPLAGYVSGLRIRLNRHVIPHYIMACEDDVKEVGEIGAAGRTPAPGESLDYRNNAQMNRNMQALGGALLAGLREVQKRVKAGGGVQA